MKTNFNNEISKLVKEGVISQDIAVKIEDYYKTKHQGATTNKLFTIFGILGSLLIGLGIILMLAHNWDHFSRSIKTILAFSPLVIGQFIVGYSIIKKKSTVWLESSGVFLFFTVGSSISLISQIYNIPGDINSFLLIWLLLCIPLIYLLNSKSLLILSLFFSTFYACSFIGSSKIPWMYLLLIITILPFYLRMLKYHPLSNSTTIFNWLLPLSIVASFGVFLDINYHYLILLYILLFGILYNIGKMKFINTMQIRKNGYLIIGSLGLVGTMLCASSAYFWKNRFFSCSNSYYHFNDKEIIISALLVAGTIALLFYNNISLKFHWKNVFSYISLLVIIVFSIHSEVPRVSVYIVNLFILIMGITTIKKGVKSIHFGMLNYGLIIITTVVIARFFDTKLSFIIRGLLFIIVGVGFFTTNYIMLKKIKKIKKINKIN